jgi:hypothetical protein
LELFGAWLGGPVKSYLPYNEFGYDGPIRKKERMGQWLETKNHDKKLEGF